MATEHGRNGEGVVPPEAWTAASTAFDSPEWTPETDDLGRALLAASPHIRSHELSIQLEALMAKAALVPLLGRKNTGVREGLDAAIKLLTERMDALEAPNETPSRQR